MIALWAYLIIGAGLGSVSVAATRHLERRGKANASASASLAHMGAPVVIAVAAFIWPVLLIIAYGGKKR